MLALEKGEKNGLVCAYALLHQTGMIKQVSTTQKYVKLIPWYMNMLFLDTKAGSSIWVLNNEWNFISLTSLT